MFGQTINPMLDGDMARMVREERMEEAAAQRRLKPREAGGRGVKVPRLPNIGGLLVALRLRPKPR